MRKVSIFDAPKDCILTFSGIYINVFKPTPEMINIKDIAHALSRAPRFGGHLNRPYSVAQHSVMCARKAKTKKTKREALLHDASEAYLCDLPSPIKAKIPQYKKIETKLMSVIFKKYNLSFPLTNTIHKIDRKELIYEWNNFKISDNKKIECWSRAKAKREFLNTYNELFT